MDGFNNDRVCLSCTHPYHKQCLQEYFKTTISQRKDIECPICRNIEIPKGSNDYIYLARKFCIDCDMPGQSPAPVRVRPAEVQIVIHSPTATNSISNTDARELTINNKKALQKKMFWTCSIICILIIIGIILFQFHYQ